MRYGTYENTVPFRLTSPAESYRWSPPGRLALPGEQACFNNPFYGTYFDSKRLIGVFGLGFGRDGSAAFWTGSAGIAADPRMVRNRSKPFRINEETVEGTVSFSSSTALLVEDGRA
jgi:hypothetical protein